MYNGRPGVWHGSYYNYDDASAGLVRVGGEGSYFRGKHELKFGYSWRQTTLDSYSSVPGNSIVTYHDGYPNMTAIVWSDSKLLSDGHYNSLWFGDTIVAVPGDDQPGRALRQPDQRAPEFVGSRESRDALPAAADQDGEART